MAKSYWWNECDLVKIFVHIKLFNKCNFNCWGKRIEQAMIEMVGKIEMSQRCSFVWKFCNRSPNQNPKSNNYNKLKHKKTIANCIQYSEL